MAVLFDGTVHYRLDDFLPGKNSATDNKTGIVSCWVYFGSGTTIPVQRKCIFDGARVSPLATIYALNVGTADNGVTWSVQWIIAAFNGGLAIILETNFGTILPDRWNHILISYDGANARGDILVNGVVQTLQTSIINNFDLGADLADRHMIGRQAFNPISNPFDGRIDEIYFNTVDYLDFTTASNIREFYGARGEQIGLGHKARNPTGNQPYMFYTHGPGNFGHNEGTGGGVLSGIGTTATITGPPPAVETLSRGWWGEEWRESERSGIPFRESRLVIEPATGLEVARREFSTDRDEINRRRRYGHTIFEF